MVAKEKRDVIDKEIALCGYFVIISSEKMTAEDALDLYKSRDASEKLFKGDKSYLGNRSMRTQTDESMETKILIEFVALIIRNKIYTCLRNESRKADSKANYMTVPAALKELEKIEMIKSPDGEYRLNYAVSATQKAILKAFGMTSDNIKKQAKELGTDLKQ
jgi:transposase